LTNACSLKETLHPMSKWTENVFSPLDDDAQRPYKTNRQSRGGRGADHSLVALSELGVVFKLYRFKQAERHCGATPPR